MAEFYYPTSQETLDLLLTVPQGFQIEFSEENRTTLFIKFDMAVLIAIIKGCRLRLKILNPLKSNVPYQLEISDNKWNPLWINCTAKIEDSTIHEDVMKLIELKRLRICLLNETTAPIYSFTCDVEKNYNAINLWLANFNGDDLLLKKGNLIIDIKNRDHSSEPKFTVITNQLSNFGSMDTSGSSFNVHDFLYDGKHGYTQESSLQNILSPHFVIDHELFVSPKNEDGTEFCDFIVLLDNSYILFESKFIISTKITRESEQIKKGVRQLARAITHIFEGTISLENKKLEEELLKRKFPLKILLHNGAVNLTQNKCIKWLDYPTKMHLPMFMSIIILNQFINSLRITNPEHFRSNLEINLLHYFDRYMFDVDQPDFLIFDHFETKKI